MNSNPVCPACGKPLPPDAPAGLCPECLLQSATRNPSAETLGAATIPGASPASSAGSARPVAGEMFGGYRILRLLGRGGMGEVWEADHVESSRRVALKVMSHKLASDVDRKRFLREGRLAASVTHPNVIYIFGSEEIAGTPVIAMELVHEGTLKDLVKKRGPLPVDQAVDYTLQLIAGLDAAHQAGVLHRDIKPTNAFLGADGTVKIGDFGLSISTLARPESLVTTTGSVIGTPALASPEQLRGEELDVRSDIYSAGATLYFLLTGKLPFHAEELVKLIATVLDKPAESPAAHRPDLPPALCRIMMRCLSKDRKQRFANYEELAAALLPFGKAAAKPANPGLRFVAGAVDDFIAWAPQFAALLWMGRSLDDQFYVERTLTSGLMLCLWPLWAALYYAICEGLWGAGAGKALCGLRVVGVQGAPPGFLRALGRAALFGLISLAPVPVTLFSTTGLSYAQAVAEWQFQLAEWAFLPLFILFFSTLRRANGWAALHDLATRTRVVAAPSREAPLPIELLPMTAALVETPQKLGPYALKARLAGWGAESLWLAHDDALRRDVWIHRQPAGAPAVSARRRELSRPTRLRWLNGRRDERESWDAYEAPAGRRLVELLEQPQPWRAARFWLRDLAGEFDASQQHDSVAPMFRLDHIWVRQHGHAMLLDFPCPGLATIPPPPGAEMVATDLRSLQQLLKLIADAARRGRDGNGPLAEGPAPAAAQAFLQRLAGGAFESLELLCGNLQSLVQRPAVASARLRIAAVLMPVGFALAVGITVGFVMHHGERQWDDEWARAFGTVDEGRFRVALAHGTEAPDESAARQAAIYIGAKFAGVLSDESFWSNPKLGGGLTQAERAFLTNALAQAREASADERTASGKALESFVNGPVARWTATRISFSAITSLLVLSALLSLVATLATGQPLLLRLLGLMVVDRDGRPVTRLRAAWRWAAGWLALVAGGVVLLVVMALESAGEMAPVHPRKLKWPIQLAVFGLAGALYSFKERPWRGWPDCVAGTYVVPR